MRLLVVVLAGFVLAAGLALHWLADALDALLIATLAGF